MILRSPWVGAALLAGVPVVLAGCDAPAPTEPALEQSRVPALNAVSQVYTSGSHVQTWDAIAEPNQPWPYAPTFCTATPQVGLNASWTNPHNAYVVPHPWQNDYFVAPWINAWSTRESVNSGSVGPRYYNWTKYRTQVAGNGSFVIRLLADNCSWIYLDGILVGRQDDNLSANAYGLTLNGTHTLEFIIFDGGGASGGKFILETTTNPPPPLNPDLDSDGHENDVDAFPLNPAEWADTDGDGVGDNGDDFPNDPSEQTDSDGDSVGDNADPYPHDPTRWTTDGDGDGIVDDQDAFPNDPTEWSDSDGDGAGDNSDAFPADPSETKDSDGDGYGDNGDAFPGDPGEWQDTDGDGHGDNGDAFPVDASEWADTDGDGVGDNADAYDASDTRPHVVIGTCNSGVANRHMGDGSWFNDLVASAQASATNHGKFVQAMTTLADGWKKAGLITGREHGAIVSCAARNK